ncbi:beta glucosidase 12 [Euphorbia peplus]|nr:beta glucosidase 12 [Euphorbia peplus]
MFGVENKCNKRIGYLLCIITHFLVFIVAHGQNNSCPSFTRASFPQGFLIGSASASIQYEGAAAEDGKGPSIWDKFVATHRDRVADHRDPSVANDQYHRYKEDVAIMKDLGFEIYRMSISWPRVLPKGNLKGGVNQAGINYYNNLINELLANGIKPVVTLFHWDSPQALEDEYQGFLNRRIVDDFRDYADLCFKTFGDRVKMWLTMNEPLTFSTAYTTGIFAPGRCSNRTRCTAGDSAREPYIVGHNILLCHSAAVKVYREKYQNSQKGQIGIPLNTAWHLPLSPNSTEDQGAAARAVAFQLGWFMDPLYSGAYPPEMVKTVGNRLPTFTAEESKLLKGSYDFIGVNYYTTTYASPPSSCQPQDVPTYYTDRCVNDTGFRNGVPIGPLAGTWILIYPDGFKQLVLHIKNKYNDPVMYITENGVIEEKLDDKLRVDYYQNHLAKLSEAIKLGAKVKGYMLWSLLDNFEWVDGYTSRFGIVHIDFDSGLKRTLRSSALWFKSFMKAHAQNNSCPSFTRESFPKGFLIGSASSAYQVEGAAFEDGRKASIWDTFIKKNRDRVDDHSNADIAVDQYHRYKEDVAIMKNIGFDVYRFSISWPRVLPNGNLKGGVNQAGINYYNNLINELLANGIKPLVTLFHWDTPQALEDQYQGFLSPKIIDDFRDYADLCFKTFGDRVKIWVTLNEPLSFSTSYSGGDGAPGRCSNRTKCVAGESSTEPYIAGHNQILAHAAAAKLYKEKYQISQKGEIGIALNAAFMIPLSNSTEDQLAVARGLAFQLGWFMEPLHSGSYPPEMIAKVGNRLPKFSKKESEIVKGSYDFVGVNYYTTIYAFNSSCNFQNGTTYINDRCVNGTGVRNGIPLGPKAGTWILIYPEGLRDLVLYLKHKYNDPAIYITENGVMDANIDDKIRVEYFQGHLTKLHEAIKLGAKVKGYTAWSFSDNFEWLGGFTTRFGIVYIDYENGLKRTLKSSALWFKSFLNA